MNYLDLLTIITQDRLRATAAISNMLRLSAEDRQLVDNQITLLLDRVLSAVNAQDNGQTLEQFKCREVRRG